MSDDLLQRAAKALRDEADSREAGGRQLPKHLILQTIEGNRRASAQRWAVGAPLALLLVTSTAIAAATGVLPVTWQKVKQLVGAEEQTVTVAPADSVAAGAHRTAKSAPRQPRTAAETANVEQAAPAAEEPVQGVESPQQTPQSPDTAPTPPTPPTLTLPTPVAPRAADSVRAHAPKGNAVTMELHRDRPTSRELLPAKPLAAEGPAPAPAAREPAGAARDLPIPAQDQPVAAPAAPPAAPEPAANPLHPFREAQRLQFKQKNWAAALAAWDTYLQQSPHGALAPEARWNRAICLVRLDRTAEAR